MEKIATWIGNIGISLDQLGNAIGGGNPDVTISSRVGYFSSRGKKNSRFYYFWRMLEIIIDTTFYPVDGPNHCRNALESDRKEMHVHGNDLARGILGFIAIAGCVVIGIFTWTLYLLGHRPKSTS